MTPPDDVVVDFVGGALGYRHRHGGGKGQALHKAVGFGKGPPPLVADATAGLGRDAFLLAAEGARVILIERAPAVQALLADGLARAAAAGPEYAAISARMTLIRGDARAVLPALPERPDVVLVDPMHPPRGNSALVKKDMRLLRELVGADPDAAELMAAALATAVKRVVLKWPLRADFLPGLPKPSHQILGKSTRYDVFMIHHETEAGGIGRIEPHSQG